MSGIEWSDISCQVRFTPRLNAGWQGQFGEWEESEGDDPWTNIVLHCSRYDHSILRLGREVVQPQDVVLERVEMPASPPVRLVEDPAGAREDELLRLRSMVEAQALQIQDLNQRVESLEQSPGLSRAFEKAQPDHRSQVGGLMAWLKVHREEYLGKWVAVLDGDLVASAKTLRELDTELKKNGISSSEAIQTRVL